MKGLNNAIRQHWDDGANDAVRQRIAQKHFNDLKQVKKPF